MDQLSMFSQITNAAKRHPERAEFDRLITMGHEPVQADYQLENTSMITLKSGRASYKLQNSPGRLEKLAAVVAKSPCWNGRKSPKRRSTVIGGAFYYHQGGFRLWVPLSLISKSGGTLSIGSVKLKMHTNARGAGVLSGAIPASWMVDLNADSACTHEVTE